MLNSTAISPIAQRHVADSDSWIIHLQADAGIVADSQPAAEYQETINKAQALARAIDLAEAAFAKTEQLAPGQ